MPPARPKTGPRNLPELLAPAGSPEAFHAALAAGADAIYLSGKRFGARKFAANFTEGEIEESIRSAHSHGVRVYVTVNTLVHDHELAAVTEYLVWLYSIGVDAVLIQDAGLAALARELVPGLVIHASTQMTIHNAVGVRHAATQGFSRVVLARELALDEVRRIAEATRDTGCGLEIFVHGALCYGYSGQCLLSSVIGGRSGNRGSCAQPCRKLWTYVTGTADERGRPGGLCDIPSRDRYLLSPKDLCTYRQLSELAGAPVASLKIEGRMKSPEYVAIVVSTYRRALDAIAAGTGEPSAGAERDLLLAFNRGFSKGYLFGDRQRALMGRDAPGNRGLCIGTVVRYDKARSEAVIRPGIDLDPEPGDGLLIVHPDAPGETGFALNTVPKAHKEGFIIPVPRPVRPGSSVFVTSSRALDAAARRIVAKPPADLLRPVPLDLVATVGGDGVLTLCGTVVRPDGTPVPVPVRPMLALAPATTRPLTRDELAQQLAKTGGTPFVVRSLDLAYNGDRFAPIKEVNHLRRELLAAANEALVESFRPAVAETRHAQQRWQERAGAWKKKSLPATPARAGMVITVWTGSLDGVRTALDAGAERICYEPDLFLPTASCGGKKSVGDPYGIVSNALALCRTAGVPLFWKLPRIIPDRFLDAVIPALPRLAADGLPGVLTDDRGAAALIRTTVPDLPLFGGPGLNIFNHASALASGGLFASVTLSVELRRDEIVQLLDCLRPAPAAPACSLIVQGPVEAMVTEDCIKTLYEPCAAGEREQPGGTRFSGIRDEKGEVWPVWQDHACRTIIGSPAELGLIGHLASIAGAGIREIVIDARHRPPQYIATMIPLYRQAIAAIGDGRSSGAGGLSPAALEKKAATIAGRITTGHFLRGLTES